jgi:xanthine dehydrogenase YagS FAD-binding subunit
MIPFSFDLAGSEDDAIAGALAGGRFIAGGTTLVDLMREEVEQPTRLIDINQLPLHYIRNRSTGLSIGALSRMAEVAADPVVAEVQPLIVQALLEGASPQIRNMASIGGNLLQRVRCSYFRALDTRCNKRTPGSGCDAIDGANRGHAILGTSEHCVATHPSDLAVALVALDASVRTRGANGERVSQLEDLYRLPDTTPHLEHTLLPGELIVEVHVPHGPYAQHARYVKVRDRASYEFALVSVAAALFVEQDVIREVRLAAGGVAPRPWRLRECESAIVGRRVGRATWERAAEFAASGARPLANNAYKVELLRRTVIRALEMVNATYD